MAYIGKVSVSNTWAKVEDLIKAQVDGQSSFAFDTSKTYTIQVQGHAPAYFVNAASAPTTEDAGDCIQPYLFGKYKPDSDNLYVKSYGGKNTCLSVSELS